MAYSKIQIISLALIEIGKAPINEIEDAADLGAAADLQYELILDDILSNYSWRFATAQTQLSQLAASPLKRWKYAYELPADYLAALQVIPYSEYEIYEKYIYSNMSELYLEYRFRPDHTRFPSYFVNYFKLELASSLARFATVKDSIAQRIMQAAQKAEIKSIATDSMSRPNEIIADSKLINVRRFGRTITY